MIQRHCFPLALGITWSVLLSLAVGQPAAPMGNMSGMNGMNMTGVPGNPAGGGGAPMATAPPARKPVDVSTDVKTANQLDAAALAMIDVLFQPGTKDPSPLDCIKSTDPAQLKFAKESFSLAGHVSPPKQMSPAYASAYCQKLNASLLPIFKNANSFHVKLNIAIIAARVANDAHDPSLEPLVQAILDEKHEGLRLWGTRAAAGIMPGLMRVAGHKALLDKVLRVANQPANADAPFVSGKIIGAAFDCLTPDNVNAAILGIVLKPLMNMAQKRVNEYVTDLPREPSIDQKPFVFLTQAGVYGGLTPAQRLQVMQMMQDLIVHSAVRSAQFPNQRNEFAHTIDLVAQSIAVAATQEKAGALENLAIQISKAAKFKGANLPVVIKELAPAIAQTSPWQGWGIKPTPPTLPPKTKPTTAPAN